MHSIFLPALVVWRTASHTYAFILFLSGWIIAFLLSSQPVFVFVLILVFGIPLHAARRAMAAAVPLPLKATTAFTGIPISDPRPLTHREVCIVGVSQHLFPRTARKNKTKERESQKTDSFPPSLLRHPLGSGLDLHLDLRFRLLSQLLLGGRGLGLGCLGGLCPLLPARPLNLCVCV